MNSQVKLTTIEELTISSMVNLMEIWPGELQAKLREMTVERCHGLSNILFPSNSIKGIQNLELLKVVNCQSIGVAFDLEGLVWEGILDVALPSLKKTSASVVSVLDSPSQLCKASVPLPFYQGISCGVFKILNRNEPNADDADDAVITNIIMFPQLSSLKLSDLPNLRSFCSQTCAFDGSLLKTIKVINCPKMKILPSAFQRKLEQQKADLSTSSQHHLLDGKIIFRDWNYSLGKFRQVTITDINGSIEMWHNQLEVDRLDKVRFMLVQCCWKLSSVISLNLMQRLQYLEQLKVWWCDSLEMIFDLQGLVCASTTSEEGTSIFTWLEDLKLMYLPKLMHIWKNVSQQAHCFTNLSSLEVERCDNLRYIFTISMVDVLVNLNYLRIENCEKLEKIVIREAEEKIVTREEEEEEEEEESDDDDEDGNGDDERGKVNIFSVELENFRSLVCIGIPESLIRISKLRVNFCPKYRGNQLYFYANMLLSL
ncbi:hypothetical protein ACSBR1_035019 [Camellia fascicularis]